MDGTHTEIFGSISNLLNVNQPPTYIVVKNVINKGVFDSGKIYIYHHEKNGRAKPSLGFCDKIVIIISLGL